MLVADMAERGGDPVQERLAADEAVIGQQIGAECEMLARAETDLQVKRAIIAEQEFRGNLALGRDGDRGVADSRPARPGPAAICARSTGRRGG